MQALVYIDDEKVLAVTSLRDGGVSSGCYASLNLALHVGDEIDRVLQNRQAFFDAMNIDLNRAVFMQQTHSINVHKATQQDCGAGSKQYQDGIADTDSLYTREKNIPLVVFHADCVPIIIYSQSVDFAMVIHAGWRGTINEITRISLQKVIEQEQIEVADLKAIIGPHIYSFEVDQDIINKLNNQQKQFLTYEIDKTYLSLADLNIQQLQSVGINIDNIKLIEQDTYTNTKFFSYRRENVCGRHISVVMLK